MNLCSEKASDSMLGATFPQRLIPCYGRLIYQPVPETRRVPAALQSPVVVIPMLLGKDCKAARNCVITVVRQHLHVKKLLAQASFEGQHQQSSAVESCGDRQVAMGTELCSLGSLSDKLARRRQLCHDRFA